MSSVHHAAPGLPGLTPWTYPVGDKDPPKGYGHAYILEGSLPCMTGGQILCEQTGGGEYRQKMTLGLEGITDKKYLGVKKSWGFGDWLDRSGWDGEGEFNGL